MIFLLLSVFFNLQVLPLTDTSFFLAGIGADDRLSAEEMDEMRDKATAYEYLCHLEEAKQLSLFARFYHGYDAFNYQLAILLLSFYLFLWLSSNKATGSNTLQLYLVSYAAY